ncbi:MAG: hypothetical protein ACE5LV_06520 [Candidatus Aminicenantales bacterium]
MSFYYVLSREPHPGFYGFTQPDSLEMRQEYTRLARAELQFDIPWIIDDMENTLQRTFGGMPNMEFFIDADGTLLAKWEWANPEKLKAFLEEKIGPSGISEKEWDELSRRTPMAVSLRNNDEVPATQVPWQALSPLEVQPAGEIPQGAPLLLEAHTLPPRVTPGGQSRLYLTIKPDSARQAFFDNAQPAEILLENPSGVDLKKTRLVAGRRIRGKDIYPHTLGVMWTSAPDTETLAFTATVKARLGAGTRSPRGVSMTFHISGSIPSPEGSMDEILPEKMPAKDGLQELTCSRVSEEELPFRVAAWMGPEPAHPGQGMIYLTLEVEEPSGYVWNNLASPPRVTLKPVSGVELEKSVLQAGKRSEEDDADPRILAFWFKKQPGAPAFVLDVTPDVWVCSHKEGWCRRFMGTFRIQGNF